MYETNTEKSRGTVTFIYKATSLLWGVRYTAELHRIKQNKLGVVPVYVCLCVGLYVTLSLGVCVFVYVSVCLSDCLLSVCLSFLFAACLHVCYYCACLSA